MGVGLRLKAHCEANSLSTSRCRSLIVAITNTSIIEVLRRPLESGQYTSWAFSHKVRT